MGSETVKCCREWAVYADNVGAAILVHADSDAGEERIKLPQGEHEHCRKCGARFSLRADGTVEVGPSQDRLLAALYNMVEMAWFPGCPGDLEWPCPCGATCTEDVACERDPDLCALEWAGLTESEAAALWKWMKEVASDE